MRNASARAWCSRRRPRPPHFASRGYASTLVGLRPAAQDRWRGVRRWQRATLGLRAPSRSIPRRARLAAIPPSSPSTRRCDRRPHAASPSARSSSSPRRWSTTSPPPLRAPHSSLWGTASRRRRGSLNLTVYGGWRRRPPTPWRSSPSTPTLSPTPPTWDSRADGRGTGASPRRCRRAAGLDCCADTPRQQRRDAIVRGGRARRACRQQRRLRRRRRYSQGRGEALAYLIHHRRWDVAAFRSEMTLSVTSCEDVDDRRPVSHFQSFTLTLPAHPQTRF